MGLIKTVVVRRLLSYVNESIWPMNAHRTHPGGRESQSLVTLSKVLFSV